MSIVQRNLRLPDDLVWDGREAICHLEVKEDCVEVTVFFIPNTRTHRWFASRNGVRTFECRTDGDRGPNQRFDLWIALEVWDRLSGDEIDKFLLIAIENEIRRCYAWNDFMFYDLEKRENENV